MPEAHPADRPRPDRTPAGARATWRAVRRSFERPLTKRLLFLHVPKCGGTSVRLALREAYTHPLFSGSRRHIFHVSPHRSRRAAEMSGRPLETFRDDLLRYHLSDDRIRLATGHFGWPDGLREHFPDVSVLTLLRDPVSHFLSGYYEAREERGQDADRKTRADLGEFVETDWAHRIGCRFVRTFAGPVEPGAALSPDVLELACRRLASVEVLGVLEDLGGLVDAFEARFGVRLAFPHANAGSLRARRNREPVDPELRARIEQVVRPNRLLYDFVIDELERRRSSARGAPADR
jgi:hypothetical protein